ncbi:uncharacterized protein M6B38_187320 [Iris pallida]|uniref:Uncharacterized protein n=1 Tax=Iris pallida TaxID=29817 RepID=A0AAX6EK08_IRIPA|nr:uncharacterized protein M6B38_187320 [Iris pallida]
MLECIGRNWTLAWKISYKRSTLRTKCDLNRRWTLCPTNWLRPTRCRQESSRESRWLLTTRRRTPLK